jgi:predicted enzyme related to lactoylglutathione lyase
VLVNDIEATAAKVAGAGGTVMQPPMDIAEAGRMAIIADPSGAVFCLWQGKQHHGADLMGEHGSMVWMELTTPEPPAVAPFYGQVLGWTSQTMGPEMGNYVVFDTATGVDNGVAGAMTPQVEGIPPYWGVYFAVDDCDASAAHAGELAPLARGRCRMCGARGLRGLG